MGCFHSLQADELGGETANPLGAPEKMFGDSRDNIRLATPGQESLSAGGRDGQIETHEEDIRQKAEDQADELGGGETANPLRAPEKMFGDDRDEVAALIQLRDATNYTQWTENKEGWDLLELGMTGKQAKECKPNGVYFDADGHVTKIILEESGLSGQAYVQICCQA